MQLWVGHSKEVKWRLVRMEISLLPGDFSSFVLFRVVTVVLNWRSFLLFEQNSPSWTIYLIYQVTLKNVSHNQFWSWWSFQTSSITPPHKNTHNCTPINICLQETLTPSYWKLVIIFSGENKSTCFCLSSFPMFNQVLFEIITLFP